MGYRSQVGFVIKRNNEAGLEIPKFEEIENCFDFVRYGEEAVFYHSSWVKWYDYGPSDNNLCDQVEAFLNKIGEVNDNDYLFIRLGEDDGDMDSKGNYWDNEFDFGYKRELTYNVTNLDEEEFRNHQATI